MEDEYILGFKYRYHDPSCVISKNGEIVFGIEEERLNRKKHANGCFPIHSVKACLDYCDISLKDVKKIVIPRDPELKRLLLKNNFKKSNGVFKGFLKRLTPYYLFSYLSSDRIKRKELDEIYQNLSSLCKPESFPPIEFKSHHLCHAASAFHFSDFKEALVITVDSIGDHDSTVIWTGNENGLKRVYTYEFPNSLGAFYGGGTGFIGYRPNNGEYKVMGLAAYGERNKDIKNIFDEYIKKSWDYDVTGIVSDVSVPTIKSFEKVFDKPRKTDHNFTDWDKSFAFHLQETIETILCNVVEHYVNQTGLHDVCIAGGVGLNCKMNKKLMELDCVDNIFVQPVAHDAGLSVGAVVVDSKPSHVKKLDTVYFGPSFSNDYVENIFDKNKISYKKPDNLLELAAQEIADGKLVGWFQGRMEMGPRALGNRSILADPRTQKSKDRVNHFVKHRENWRPFAPSILEEYAGEYLKDYDGEAGYMTKTYDVKKEHINNLSAVVHPADFTTRPQTVTKNQNPRYYNLIKEFYKLTGIPVILNTSFNDHGEPIVCNPVEAVRDFYGMGLDLLVINDVIIQKEFMVKKQKESASYYITED